MYIGRHKCPVVVARDGVVRQAGMCCRETGLFLHQVWQLVWSDRETEAQEASPPGVGMGVCRLSPPIYSPELIRY